MVLLNVSSFGLNFVLDSIFLGFPIACVVVIWKQVKAASQVSSMGDTFGHRMFGMRITATNAERIGRRRALVRQILGSPVMSVYIFPTVFFRLVDVLFDFTLAGTVVANWLIWGMIALLNLVWLNLFWMVFDRRWRGWDDVVVGTVVVRGRVG